MHPQQPTLPPWVVLHLPHVSTRIPADVRDQFVLDDDQLAAELEILTDHHVIDLFLDAACSTPNVRADVSRLVVDVERFVEDAREPAARHGFGAIYTKTTGGKALRRPLRDGKRNALLQRHAAHHARLAAAVHATLDKYGKCLVLDCHSFPDRPLPFEVEGAERDRPDICIGTDAFHTPRELARAFVAAFEAEGWTVAVDWPFAGALVPEPFLGRDARVSALMIEVNRRLCRDDSGPVEGPQHPIARRVRAACAAALRDAGELHLVHGEKPGCVLRHERVPVEIFKVHDGNRLEDPTTYEPRTRAECYEAKIDGWTESPKALGLNASDFEPLQWAVHPVYEDARLAIEDDCYELQSAAEQLEDLAEEGESVDEAKLADLRKRLAARKAVLDAMPEDPYDGALGWLRKLDNETFRAKIVPAVEEWLADSPGIGEEDYLPGGGTAQGAAFEFFSNLDPGTMRTLGVKVVEGDRPGSTYYAAELRRSIDGANAAASEHGIPVRFVPAQTVCGPVNGGSLAESAISEEKIRAYCETVYAVEAPRALRLRIGQSCDELACVYRLWGMDTCAFVTACNPFGEALDDRANAERQAALRKELQGRRLTLFEGAGEHSSNGWPPEPSLLVLGLGLDEARELGTRWGQDAVVWAGPDAISRLVLLR